MATTMAITPSEILQQRASRKAAGLVGCITGRPAPALDFYGFRDVQIWYRDAEGRLNGDPGFNYKDPYCFCFDCRGAFDPKGTVDAELVNEGHERAVFTYRSTSSKTETSTEQETTSAPSTPPPTTTSTATPGFSNEPSTPPPKPTRSSPPPLATRTRGGGL